MVGLIKDLAHVTTQSFQSAGDLIYIIGETKEEFGGSELQKLVHGEFFGKAPEIDLIVEVKRQKQLLTAIRSGKVASAHDISEGGAAVAIAESAAVAIAESLFGTNLGAEVELAGHPVAALFSETQSRFIVSVKAADQTAFEEIVEDAKLIGKVKDQNLSL